MEIKIISLIILTFLVSCKQNANLFSKKKYDNNGNYYQFKYQSDTTYQIIWGNNKIKQKSKRNFEVLGNGELNLVESGKNAIILGQSCGTSCFYNVILPIDQQGEKIYIQAIASDINKHLIAYIPDNKSFIIIENYLTGQKIEIQENNLCPAAYKGDCIDSCYFKDENFILKWQGVNWNENKFDPQEKIIPVKF